MEKFGKNFAETLTFAEAGGCAQKDYFKTKRIKVRLPIRDKRQKLHCK